MRLYVSFTSIPTRLGFVPKMLESLLSQARVPDKIFLHLPERYANFETRYHVGLARALLAPYIDRGILHLHVMDRDHGPARKFTGMIEYLELEPKLGQEPFAVMICDDDHEYRPYLCERLLQAYVDSIPLFKVISGYRFDSILPDLPSIRGADTYLLPGEALLNDSLFKLSELCLKECPDMYFNDDFIAAVFCRLNDFRVLYLQERLEDEGLETPVFKPLHLIQQIHTAPKAKDRDLAAKAYLKIKLPQWLESGVPEVSRDDFANIKIEKPDA